MELKENITGLQHLGVPTNDIEKTISFYQSLGFGVALRTVNEAANEHVAFLRLHNLTIETYENHQAALCNGAVDHIALDVSNIQAAFDKVSGLGYKMLHTEIQFLPFWERGVRFFTIEGLNHEKVEFSQML
jgi:lactoylglutathione lyase